MSDSVTLGATFPQSELSRDRGAVRAWAEAVVELGYTHALIADHVLGADTRVRPEWKATFTYESVVHEAFVVLGYMAGIAPQLELATCILVAPQRQTALVAKQAAELDVLTGGKFRLGVGLGWNEVEYEALGVDFRTRGNRLEEQIDVMRRLWREPSVTFEGRWHSIAAAGLNPLPERREIPVWFGGHAEPALRRAARLGDGLFPQVGRSSDREAARELITRLRGWVGDAGRDPRAFGVEPIVAHGADLEAWRRAADVWWSAGATHFAVDTRWDGLQTADNHIERLRLVAEALGAQAA